VNFLSPACLFLRFTRGRVPLRRAVYVSSDEKGPTITIGAGVTVQALCDHLDARGFALRWAGNSGSQTLVGAAITGTHGYSRDDDLLAELIVGARVITGTGEILAIDDERELRALRVSLGTLCTITSVTLSLIPSGSLVRYSLSTLDESDFLSRLCRDARSNEYFRDLHVRKGPHASEFLHELELELKDVLCVRPHWGKEFALGHDDLAAAYPAGSWAAFRAAKRRYDRDNVSANAYTQRVFGWYPQLR
jgi:FAD/FMN-containing dehydrogenase